MTASMQPSSFTTLVAHAFGWPARVVEARRVRACLAELSERERQDIGGMREYAPEPIPETPEERQWRLRAIRAWYPTARAA